eukprot:6189368-Pleurochrysis_carterae.AAC.3
MEPLAGASHIVVSENLMTALLVPDSRSGVFLRLAYNELLHANLATLFGKHFVVAAYCGRARAAGDVGKMQTSEDMNSSACL